MRKIVHVFRKLPGHMPIVVLSCLLALFGGEALGVDPKVAVAVEQGGEAFIVDATIDVPVSLGIAWGVLIDFDHMTSLTLRVSVCNS